MQKLTKREFLKGLPSGKILTHLSLELIKQESKKSKNTEHMNNTINKLKIIYINVMSCSQLYNRDSCQEHMTDTSR